MSQNKLARFAAIERFANVWQKPAGMAGRWQQEAFKHTYPITLELACGKGEYTTGLAAMYPQRNFLGVDVKGNRIYVGAKHALANQLTNVAFLRTQIEQIDLHFGPEEVSEIWITFPDPQIRPGKHKKRLTHPVFLRRYHQFLKPGAFIHLKTDSPILYAFTCQVIEQYGCTMVTKYDDVRQEAQEPELLNITTHYEKLDIAQSGKIFYVCFKLPGVLADKGQDELLKKWVFEHEATGNSYCNSQEYDRTEEP